MHASTQIDVLFWVLMQFLLLLLNIVLSNVFNSIRAHLKNNNNKNHNKSNYNKIIIINRLFPCKVGLVGLLRCDWLVGSRWVILANHRAVAEYGCGNKQTKKALTTMLITGIKTP